MAQEAAKNFGKVIPVPTPNQLVECRGSTWRFLREDKGLWQLELIKQGAHFSEECVRVWAIPQLERKGLKLLSLEESLWPRPSLEQFSRPSYYKAHLQTRKRHALEASFENEVPRVALESAIETKPWQFGPWQRIVHELPFPRLLLADDVGLGKTTEAAIILAEMARRRRADRVLIITPHHLCEKWQDELYERFGMAFEIYDRTTRERLSEKGVKNPWQVVERVIVSRDFLKRWENLKPVSGVEWDMVVIDECHHFVKDRNNAAKRLREAAERIVYNSPGLLLLSATPFTGQKEEFMGLLELIDPSFGLKEGQKWDPQNPFLIRRTKKDLKAESFPERIVRHVEITEDDLTQAEKEALKLIGQDLEAQRKRRDRDHWDRLLEETAKKRLGSSFHAFYESISGDKKLSSWFGEKTKSKLEQLIKKGGITKFKTVAKLINNVLQEEKGAKIVIFTEAIASMRAMADQLLANGFKANEVCTLEGGTSREQRLSIEDQFADPRSSLKVLVATDTIAEGKDLQHACHHLIHLELPWSMVKIEQRNGRIDRLGQGQPPVIYNIVFATDLTSDQRVVKVLSDRVRTAGETLGSVSQIIQGMDELDLVELSSLKEADKAIKKWEEEVRVQEMAAQEMGFGPQSVAPLSFAPQLEVPSSEERAGLFKVMVEALGGKLVPNGKTQKEHLLSLPPEWDLNSLREVGEELPTEESPWRLTFDPELYLQYEKHRLQGGVSTLPLHFLGPVHPIVTQVETRFRSLMAQKGYPVFAVKGSVAREIVMAEITVRTASSRVVAQSLAFLDASTGRELPLSIIEQLTPVRQEVSLPSSSKWDKVRELLQKKAQEYTEKIGQEMAKKKRQFLSQKTGTVPARLERAMERRRKWIEEIWSVDPNNTQVQVTGLFVNQEGK